MEKLINEIDKYKSKPDSNSWILIYSHSEVILEKLNNLSNKVKELNLSDIKEARVFNENDELKIWNYQGETKRRLFSNKKNTDYKEYEENMLLWGNKVKDNNVLQDSVKKNKIEFPIDISKYTLPLKVKVKSYYEFDDNGLIIFKDARLIKILDNENKEVK